MTNIPIGTRKTQTHALKASAIAYEQKMKYNTNIEENKENKQHTTLEHGS